MAAGHCGGGVAPTARAAYVKRREALNGALLRKQRCPQRHYRYPQSAVSTHNHTLRYPLLCHAPPEPVAAPATTSTSLRLQYARFSKSVHEAIERREFVISTRGVTRRRYVGNTIGGPNKFGCASEPSRNWVFGPAKTPGP